MNKAFIRLLLLGILSFICFFPVQAQSGRVRVDKNPKPKVDVPEQSSSVSEKETSNSGFINNDREQKIPLLVMLSRQRRAAMLPASNQRFAERVSKSLQSNDRLAVTFRSEKIKREDAQKMISEGMESYVLLLRFEEFEDNYVDDDGDKDKDKCPSDLNGPTSYKMEYTLLAPKTGEVIKKSAVQTTFNPTPNAKPLFEFLVKNCVNTSSNELSDKAVQCMANQVLKNLYEFMGRGETGKNSPVKVR